MVDLHFHAVDLVLDLEHLGAGLGAQVRQRVEHLLQLRLDHAAHLEHLGRDAVELGVELTGDMLFNHDQPNLPVM